MMIERFSPSVKIKIGDDHGFFDQPWRFEDHKDPSIGKWCSSTQSGTWLSPILLRSYEMVIVNERRHVKLKVVV